MRSKFICLLLGLTTVVAPFNSEKALSQETVCRTVTANQGWQQFELPNKTTAIVSVNGQWTVDYNNFSPVSGLTGHTGSDGARLEPYSQYKFASMYPFGQLLLFQGTDNYLPIHQSTYVLPTATSSVMLRINDGHNSLADNSGSLTVCFNQVVPQKPSSPAGLDACGDCTEVNSNVIFRTIDKILNW